MKKLLLPLLALAAPVLATDYYLIGSDFGDNCPLDGRGSPKGWATTPNGTTQVTKGATDPDGVYHINGKDGGKVGNTQGSNSNPGVIRGQLSNVSVDYTFAGGQLVFDGFCPAVQARMANNKRMTFNNVLVKAGSYGEFRVGQERTIYLSGTSWVIEDGAMLALSTCEDKNRHFICDATISGGGTLAAAGGLAEYRGYAAQGNGSGKSRSVTFSGDLSGFTGIFSAGERSNTDVAYGAFNHADVVNGLTCIIAASSAFPQNTPDGYLLERSVVVTNGATISFTCDVTSSVKRGWDFGDGAQPTVNVDSGKTVTILGPVKGSAGFKKTGAGTLILNVGGEGEYDTIEIDGSGVVTAARLAEYVAACDEYIAAEASADIKWDVETNGGTVVVDGQTITTHAETKALFGHAPVAPGMPTKTEGFFVGWNTDATASTGLDLSQISIADDMTFYAIFADSIVRWFDEDGTTALVPASMAVSAGTRPTHDAPPTKPATFETGYEFAGWTIVGGDGTVYAPDDLPLAVAGQDVSYRAVFKEVDSPFLPEGFSKVIFFTVNGYDASRPTLENFPVLVRISETGLSGFRYSDMRDEEGGSDIGFVDENGDGLAFDIDTWDPTGESLVWVKLPLMKNGTKFAMVYNSFRNGKTLNSGNAFEDYVGVWHMSEENGTVPDATINGLDAVPSGTGAPTMSIAVTGRVGNARQCSTSTTTRSYLSVPSYDALSVGATFAVSGWFNVSNDQSAQDARLLSRKTNFDNANGWELIWKKDTTIAARGANGNNIKSYKQSFGTGWLHLFVVYNGKNATLYQNGVQKASGADNNCAAATDNGMSLGIGDYGGTSVSSPLVGSVDECRILDATPSEHWVKAEYDGMADPAFLGSTAAKDYGEVAETIVALSVDSVQYTNATATVTLGAKGASVSEVTAVVDVSSDDAFSTIVKTATVQLTAVGSIDVPLTGLSFGTTYYIRAAAEDDDGGTYSLGPYSFTTATPGSPEGTGAFVSVGFTKATATASASAFGTGAESATARLEASTTPDFASVVATADTVVTVGQTMTFTVEDLAPGTSYYLRVRLLNDWGLVHYILLLPCATYDVPFASSGLGWKFSPDGTTVDFSFPVTAVFEDATVDATLSYNGTTVGMKSFETAGTLSWSGVPSASGTAEATLTAIADVGGETYSKTWTVSVASDSTGYAVADVATYASAANALWMRPGDTLALPYAAGTAFYQVLNERFATMEGNLLTAIEPGIVGIRCVDQHYTTNIMGVVILPDAIGEGSVYVFDETKFNNTYDWMRPECWKKVGSNTNDSYPKNADDIAILPFYTRAGDQYIRHRENITIGGLYSGMIRPDANAMCALERYKDDTTKTVTFKRTDGNPVQIVVCPNNDTANNNSRIQLGGYAINAVFESDAVIDGCSSKTNVNGPRGFFQIKDTTDGGKKPTETVCTILLQNVTITFKGYPCYKVDGSGSTAAIYGFWKGTGTLVKEGQGGIVFNNDLGGFSGSFVLKGEKNLGGINAPASQLSLRAGGATNVSATVYGVVEVNSNGGITQNNAAGLFGTSAQVGAAPPTTVTTATFNGKSGPRGPDAPAKGLSLFGGTWYAGRIDNKTWGVDARDDKVLDYVAVGSGVSYIYLQPRNNNTEGYPINVVTVKELRQTDRGTLAVNDASRQKAITEVPATMFYDEDWADHATGAAGDCRTSSIHPVIPWILAPVNGNGSWDNTAFATFDENGRLVQETRDNINITEAAENANLYMTGKNLDYGTAGGDYTINSLYLSNGGNNRWLGEGRTLRIKSGGLILQGSSAIGLPGRTDNGALVLGDATHPAYVWAKAINANTNYLGAAVTAAGGFVSAYPGNLCLVGDQTGIADEIAVNGGTLAIGTAGADCSLADILPIRVCRGAKLFLPKSNAVANNPLKIDGSGGAFGAVELPVDQRIASVAVRDVFESTEWTTLPAGTYGSSGSGAEFVRDDLFVGPGVLTVGPAAPSTDVMLLIW